MLGRLLVVASLIGGVSITSDAEAVMLGGDFSSLAVPDGKNTLLGSSIVFNGVTVTGWQYDSIAGEYIAADLVVRDQFNDHGLGVCSSLDTDEAAGKCNIGATGGGEYNELDNGQVVEIIQLSIGEGQTWTDIVVSSLDSGDADGNEEGILFWNSLLSDPNAVLADTMTTGVFQFSDSTIGPVQTTIFANAVLGGFDRSARNIFFAAGEFYSNVQSGTPASVSGERNDYLIRSVAAVPEPATLALLGIGLLGVGYAHRRRRNHI